MTPAAEFIIDLSSDSKPELNKVAADQLQQAAITNELATLQDFQQRLEAALKQTRQLVIEWHAQSSRP